MDSPNPQRAATWPKALACALLMILGILIAGCFLLLLRMTDAFLPPMTEAQARNLIQQAGGPEKISRDAIRILHKHSNADFAILSIYGPNHEITNYPAIEILATNSHTGSIDIESGYNLPTHIRIIYGPHAHLKRMMIFDTTSDVTQQLGDSYVQLSSNIFFSK